jgi:hypothetical protein
MVDHQAFEDRRHLGPQLDGDHQADAADVADHRLPLERGAQPGQHLGAEGRAPLDQRLVTIRAQRGEASRTGQRRSAERAAMRAGIQRVSDRLGVSERAHREAAAEALREADDVGFEPGMLEAEPAAGAAEAGLDLVEDQERAALAAQSLRRVQELGGADVDAALALHRLDDDGGGRVSDRGIEGSNVVERDV